MPGLSRVGTIPAVPWPTMLTWVALVTEMGFASDRNTTRRLLAFVPVVSTAVCKALVVT
jgi:hypothetical protein